MQNGFRTTALAALVLYGGSVQAQVASLFNTSVELNAGNIVAPHLVHGDMWWNPAMGTSPIQFPKGVTGQLKGVSSIWLAGTDPQGQLRAGMQKYRSAGSDFWPGPIGAAASDAAGNQTTADWARIWRINSATIDSFRLQANHTVSNTPADILEWPGKGNTYAKGRGGASISVTKDMAPFVDINANGVYEPLSGEYPAMKGTQMLWWVLNDNCGHPFSQTGSLQLEIRISAYAYAKRPLTENVIFYDYDLRHNLSSALSNFVFAPMTDFDIDYAFNDYVGFDSARRVGVIYNESPSPSSLSRHVAGGYALMEQPGDAWGQYTAAGAFNIVRNEPESANSDPLNGMEALRIMTGYDRLGTKRVANSNYAVGYLSEQCDAAAQPGDQRFVLATTPLAFAPNQNLHYGYAFVAADSVGTCPTMNFGRLLATVDSAYSQYWHPSRFTPNANPTGVAGVRRDVLSVYPNPAGQNITIDGPLHAGASIVVVNALGATVAAPYRWLGAKAELDVSGLPAGVYHIAVLQGAERYSSSFVKR